MKMKKMRMKKYITALGGGTLVNLSSGRTGTF
jgi:hypothetical protein